MPWNFGIGGNARNSDNDTTTVSNHQAGQSQYGNVKNVSQPLTLNVSGGGTKSNTSTTVNMVDPGLVQFAGDVANISMQSAAEQGMAALAANTLVSGGAIDLAGQVIKGANDSTGKAYQYALDVADINGNVLNDAFRFGKDALGVAERSTESALFYNNETHKRSFDTIGDVVSEAFGFGKDALFGAFNFSSGVNDNAMRTVRDASANATAAVNRANDNAMQATGAALQTSGYANQRIQDATQAALNFVDKYSRSDSSVTLESVSKWVAIAVGVASLAYMLKGKKFA